jgi:hypothetical protein
MSGNTPEYYLMGFPHELANPTPHDVLLPRIEALYREHPAVRDVVVFGDQLGQLVALVVSELASDDDLRCALDEVTSRRLHGSARIVDFVSLPPGDPLTSSLFTAAGAPRRDLIWQFLVGSIETLTMAGSRLSSTSQRRPCTACAGVLDVIFD